LVLLQLRNPIVQRDKLLNSRAPAQEKNAGYKYQNTALHIEIDPLDAPLTRSDICRKPHKKLPAARILPVMVYNSKKSRRYRNNCRLLLN